MTTNPSSPEGIDTENTADMENKTVPPYEGRREAADVDGKEESTKDGVKVGGAVGPVEDDEMKAPDPAGTPGGATASPADEQPASEATESEPDDEGVGPTHYEGTGRGEDKG